jgi:subtilase family serine protease/V8-like Glu-specific endopeptidase
MISPATLSKSIGALCLAGLLIPTGGFSQTPAIPTVGTVQKFSYSSANKSNQGPGQVLVAEKILRFQKASFLQIEFSKIQLGEGSVLEVESLFDDQKQVWEWNKLSEVGLNSVYFNGDTIRIRLFAGPNTKNNSFTIKSVAIGNQVDQLPPLSICGSTDNRVRSFDRRVARLLIRKGSSVGVCTGWLISKVNCFATAGHCLSGSVTLVTAQFNVPLSSSSGAINNPPTSSQYNWEGTAHRLFENGGQGRDWGVFSTLKNSVTGRYPGSVQGSYFLFTAVPSNGTTLRVTGHGADSSPKTFNYVQQTHFGPQKVRGTSFLGYQVDTMGGNSGSPVMISSSGRAVAVHTHGGCTNSSNSYNRGTRQDYAPFASGRSRICTRRPLPDLTPRYISGPAILVAGATASISSRIHNYGTASSPATISGYYISTNSIISTGDRLIYSFTTNALAVGASHFHSASVRLPRDLQNGICYLGVYADRLRRVVEETETNNGLGTRRTCRGLPDLNPTALSSSTTTLVPNQVFWIRSTIKNIGKANSSSLLSGHYFSTNSIITTGDTLLASFTTNALVVNGSQIVTTTVRAPSSLPTGFCYLGVYADRLFRLTEISESNNTRAIRVTCSNPTRKPDLTPTFFSVSTTNWPAGANVTVRSTTKNIGQATAPSSNNGYYLSTNSIITASDTLLRAFVLPSLGVNSSVTHTSTVRIPSNVRPGVCYLGVLNDRTGSIPEVNELNNARAVRGMCFGRPDLVVTSLSTGSLTAGGTFAVRSTTKNQGTATAPNSLTGILISTNSIISTLDDYVGAYGTGTLSAGASRTVITRHSVPYCLHTGRYYVGAWADIARTVVELSESNNIRTVPVTLRGYTGSGRYIQFRPRFGTMAQSTTFASFSARAGGRAQMCITAPRLPNYWYYCLWSSRSFPFRFDSLTSFSISLVNSPIFPRWLGKLNSSGQGFPSFYAPPGVSIPVPFNAYTHVIFFTPSFSSFAGFGSNSIRTFIQQ